MGNSPVVMSTQLAERAGGGGGGEGGRKEATCKIQGFVIFFCLYNTTQIVRLTYF